MTSLLICFLWNIAESKATSFRFFCMLNQLTSMVKNICTPASRSSHDISLNSSVKRRRTTSTPVDEEDGAITRESKTSLYLNLITTLKKSSKQITFVIGPPTSTPSKRLGLVPLPTSLQSPIVTIVGVECSAHQMHMAHNTSFHDR